MSRNPADSSHDAPRARLTADEAVAAGRDFVELQAGPAGVFWTEYDPADAMCRIWRARDGVIEAVSPDGFSARGRVYEYGGGAFCLAGEQVAFVNERDQRIYRFAPGSLAAPEPLTAEGLRYGALRHARGRILAVEEEGDTHRLVSIGLHDGSRELLAEGADFYAAPVLSADGRQLAWIEWQHPHQPWTATRLKLRRYAAEGGVLDERTLAGEGDDEALQQPGFDAEGRLVCLSDRAGFWQPWRLEGERLVALPAEAGDHAGAPWQLGASSWLPLAGGELFTTWFDEGWGRLGLRAADGTLTRIAPEYSLFQQLAADETHCYCLAASPECPAAILAIDRRDRRVEVLREVAPLVPVERITQPLPLRFRSGDRDAHGYLYLPAAQQVASDGASAEPPPVVVFVHGGPTSVSHPVFSPRFEYWVQRGFAIALLNYRGSSGYGRAFRQALHLTWGVADVDDACALVEHLAAQGLVDPRRAFIRGGSAGGYTRALRAGVPRRVPRRREPVWRERSPAARRAYAQVRGALPALADRRSGGRSRALPGAHAAGPCRPDPRAGGVLPGRARRGGHARPDAQHGRGARRERRAERGALLRRRAPRLPARGEPGAFARGRARVLPAHPRRRI